MPRLTALTARLASRDGGERGFAAHLRRTLETDGRSGRAGFAAWALPWVAGWLAASWGPLVTGLGWTRWAGLLVMAILTVPAAGSLMRRLRDAGWARRWGWLVLVPFPNLVIVAVALLWPSSPRRLRWATGGIGGGLALMVAGLIALALLAAIPYRLAWVTAPGMAPALGVGDVILVRRGPLVLRRGDVVAVRAGDGEVWARVLGLPGERVGLTGGVPVLGGEPVPVTERRLVESPFAPAGPYDALPVCLNGAVGFGAACQAELVTEAWPDRTVLARDAGPRPLDRLAPVTVPAGHLFLLGDDRDAALDSRRAEGAGGLGFVPLDRITGRAGWRLGAATAVRWLDPRGWRFDGVGAKVR